MGTTTIVVSQGESNRSEVAVEVKKKKDDLVSIEVRPAVVTVEGCSSPSVSRQMSRDFS